jgi:hypothetical protein
MGYLTLSDGQEQTINSNADGRISPGEATEALADESSNASDRSDYHPLPGLIDEYAEEDMVGSVQSHSLVCHLMLHNVA